MRGLAFAKDPDGKGAIEGGRKGASLFVVSSVCM